MTVKQVTQFAVGFNNIAALVSFYYGSIAVGIMHVFLAALAGYTYFHYKRKRERLKEKHDKAMAEFRERFKQNLKI